MRKLIMWNFITLDGYFEGDKNWDLSFHELVWGPELEKISIDQLKAADCLVFGRVTYEGMAAYWKTEKGEIADLMNEINDNLFDEYRIGVAPIIAGSGRPLFQKGIAARPLTLASSQQLSTGGLIMTFKANK